MNAVAEKLDDLGKPAWIAAMVAGFIIFWPLGLALLAFLIWSGRMGCSSQRLGSSDNAGTWAVGRRDRFERKLMRLQEKMARYAGASGQGQAFRPTGNAAFDAYREDALRRLETEANEFQDFLAKLRMARDKAEFDQYMAERRGGVVDGDAKPTD